MPESPTCILKAFFFLLAPTTLLFGFGADDARSQVPGPCAVELEYLDSDGEPNFQHVDAAKGETRTVDRSGVNFVVNVAERPASIRVGTPIGGWTWVRLEDEQRSPPVGAYPGGATLSRVRCEYLHESAIPMYQALVAVGEGPIAAAGAAGEEFDLEATELLEQLNPHFGAAQFMSSAEIAGAVLWEYYGLALPAIAETLRDLGYGAEATMSGLLEAPDQFEVTSFECGPPLEAMRSADYDPFETAAAYRATRGATDAQLTYCMRSADFTEEEAAAVLYEMVTPFQARTLIGLMAGEGYGLGGGVRGTAIVLSATPVEAAGWLNGVILAPSDASPDIPAQIDALTYAFDAQMHQVFGVLLQVGRPLDEVVAGVATGFDVDAADMAGILSTTNFTVPQAATALLNEYSFHGSAISHDALLVSALREGGYPPDAVAQGMQVLAANGALEINYFQERQLVEWLIDGGYSPSEVASGFRAVFPDLAELASALRLANVVRYDFDDAVAWAAPLRDVFGADGPTLMEGLLPWDPSRAVYATGTIFDATPPQLLGWARSLSYVTGDGIGAALDLLYSPGPAEVTGWMREAGFDAVQALDALSRVRGWHIDEGYAKVEGHEGMLQLYLAGYDPADIATAVGDEWIGVDAAGVSTWLERCSGSVCPPPEPRPTGLTFANPNVVEGRTVVATVSIDAPVTGGAMGVFSSDPNVAPVPDSLHSDGSFEAALEFRAGPASTRTDVTITVSGDGDSRSAQLSVSPEPVTLSAIQLESGSVASGGSMRGSIEIREVGTRTAPVEVALSLDQVDGVVSPAAVTLTPNSPRADFVVEIPIGTRTRTTSSTAYVVATSSLGDRREGFTVEPAEVGFFTDPGRVPVGGSVLLVVELAEPAPQRAGTSLFLSTSHPELLELPDRLDVAGGRTRAEIEVATPDPRTVELENAVLVTIEAAASAGRGVEPMASTEVEILPPR